MAELAVNAELALDKVDLRMVLRNRSWSMAELAQRIGDEPSRLAAVLEGKEELGNTAYLALYAVEHNLPPISSK